MQKQKITIMLIASVSFYHHLLEVEKQLKKLGFRVKIPVGAVWMKRGYDTLAHKNRIGPEQNWKEKRRLIEKNFVKIISSDMILVINDDKNGLKGYIGGNVLMEMTLAFHYKKPVYILNTIDEKLPIREEILGIEPMFINNNLTQIQAGA